MGRRIKQKSFTATPNWSFRSGNKAKYGDNAFHPIARILYYEILQLTEGYGRDKWKINFTSISKDIGVDRKTIYKYANFLKQKGLIHYDSVKGGISMIKVNQDLLNNCKGWEQLSLLDEENGNDSTTNEEQIPNPSGIDTHQKGNDSTNPPLTKERKKVLKKNTKEVKYNFEEYWFKYSKSEALTRILTQRFYDNTEDVFNELPLNNQNKIIQSLEFAHVEWNEPNFENQYVPNSVKYINVKWEEYYEPVQKRINRIREIKEREEYNRQAELNAPSEYDMEDVRAMLKKAGWVK